MLLNLTEAKTGLTALVAVEHVVAIYPEVCDESADSRTVVLLDTGGVALRVRDSALSIVRQLLEARRALQRTACALGQATVADQQAAVSAMTVDPITAPVEPIDFSAAASRN